MVGVKTVAALVSLLNGIWGVVIGIYWESVLPPNLFPAVGIPPGIPHEIFLTLGIVLVLDSLICLIGSSKAFYVSAGISVLMILFEVIFNLDGSAAFIGGLILMLVTVGLDIAAARTRKVMAEEDHPLNLPVFG